MVPQKRYNLIIIVADTLRQDHLGCYGNDWIKTPNLDKFSKKSIVFDNCYLSSFPTMPNRADLYTGKLSFTHLGWGPMPRDEKIIPQLLKDAGYTTMAVVDTPFYIRSGYNYDRGFRDFVEVHGNIATPDPLNLEREHAVYGWRYREDRFTARTFMEARHLLERHYKDKDPFFLLVDTWDPHEPWDPPNWYTELYRPDYDGQIITPTYSRIEEDNYPKENVEIAHACYCGEITMVDEEIGIFLRQLENMKLMENTIVVFFSDHGYYFGEHGIFGKGIMDVMLKYDDDIVRKATSSIETCRWYRSPLYEEIVRIPLMVYHPDEEPKRIKALTSFIDLMPTVLDMLEVEKPDTVQGKSMIQAIQEQPFEGRDFVVSSLPLYNPGDSTRVVDAFERNVAEYSPSTITTLNWSLLYSVEKEKAELYDLKNDPKQKENIIDEHPNVARELHGNFLSVLESSKVDERLLGPRKKIVI